eukprot:CAMPEP_0195515820 /NCGR_PEP_ID=MMETSP0794_2-20130614/6751_1 /TAXON_ID=515487 /ORGANISM="Stephanopyxis turris, Strain CCMP 815" /LENGTH=159 /DNA_ID=CAMNT_0040644305 /DNA_START=29 /DNA_END=508 /DNA_ORIENTATION=-
MSTSEPLLTYLMPVYAGLSYYGLLTTTNADDLTSTIILPSATFGTAWAAFNIYRSKSMDLGVVTMTVVAVSLALEHGYIGSGGNGLTPTLKRVETVGCVLVGCNFMLALLAFKQITKMLKREKSEFWFRMFFWYCVAMVVFWAICAWKCHGRVATKNVE